MKTIPKGTEASPVLKANEKGDFKSFSGPIDSHQNH